MQLCSGLVKPLDSMGVLMELYQSQYVVHGVCAPMHLAEAAVYLNQMDQPLVGLLQNLGVQGLNLPFCFSFFASLLPGGCSSTLTFISMISEPTKVPWYCTE